VFFLRRFEQGCGARAGHFAWSWSWSSN